jgi:hypothetical protein
VADGTAFVKPDAEPRVTPNEITYNAAINTCEGGAERDHLQHRHQCLQRRPVAEMTEVAKVCDHLQCCHQCSQKGRPGAVGTEFCLA